MHNKKEVRTALIGCGGIGEVLLNSAKQCQFAALTKVYDIHKRKKHNLARKFGLLAVVHEEEIIESPSIDAVIVASPQFTHHDFVMKLARAGKHVFLEKPMALTIDQCSAMQAAMETAGKKLMVGHVLRYFQPFNMIIELTKRKVFGELLHVDIKRIEGDHYIIGSSWKGKKALSGGYLYEVAAHEIDFIRCLLGEPIGITSVITKKVPSEHEIEDRVSFSMQFDGGVLANYFGGTGFKKPEYSFSLHYENATLKSTSGFEPSAFSIDTHLNMNVESIIQKVMVPVDPYYLELKDWYSSIVEDTEVPISGIDAGETVRTIQNIYKNAIYYEKPENLG